MPFRRLHWTRPRNLWNATRKRLDFALELPEHTLPLFGFAFGWPAEDNEQKPRLPMPMKVFVDKYEEVKKEDLAAYDRTLGDYFAHRRSHPKQSSFTQEVSAIMKRERRPFVDAWLRKFGWLKG